MNLTGRQIIEQGIVFPSVQLSGVGTAIPEENVQQHGVDLNLLHVSKVDGNWGAGFIPKDGKTVLAKRMPILPSQHVNPEGDLIVGWRLEPGVYDITLAQGCKVPANQRAEIFHRSSLYRNGCTLRSALWDAGFETDQMGTQLVVMTPILIELGARIAQFVCTLSNYVQPQDQYNGQWQNDKQREMLNIDTSTSATLNKERVNFPGEEQGNRA
jgi:dUTP pyrophosphatase